MWQIINDKNAYIVKHFIPGNRIKCSPDLAMAVIEHCYVSFS